MAEEQFNAYRLGSGHEFVKVGHPSLDADAPQNRVAVYQQVIRA
jgi:hypothetical protein